MKKRIADIRYDFSKSVEEPFLLATRTPVFSGCRVLGRDGQRTAGLLRTRAYSMGTYDHLYVVLTPALAPGVIRRLRTHVMPWYRHVAIGLPRNYRRWSDHGMRAWVAAATFQILRRITPARRALLDDVEQHLRREGDETRIPRCSRRRGNTLATASFTVSSAPRKTCLILEATDMTTGRLLGSARLLLRLPTDAYALANSIAMDDHRIVLVPRKSTTAGYITEKYQRVLRIDLTARDKKLPRRKRRATTRRK